MKLALVGNSKRMEKDECLISAAKKLFEEVKYFPIDESLFFVGKTSFFKHENTSIKSFDLIFLIPTKSYFNLYLPLLLFLKKIKKESTLNFESFLMLSNRALTLSFLKKHGIKVREIICITSNQPLSEILKKMNFPIILEYNSKRVFVPNGIVLRDILKLVKIGTPINIVQPLKPKRIVFSFSTPSKTILLQKTKKDYKVISNTKLEKLSQQILNLLGCKFLTFKFLKEKDWILDKIILAPNFSLFSKFYGKLGEDIIRGLR